MSSPDREGRYKFSASESSDVLGSDRAEVQRAGHEVVSIHPAIDEPLHTLMVQNLSAAKKGLVQEYSEAPDLSETSTDHVKQDIAVGRGDQVKSRAESSLKGREQILQDSKAELTLNAQESSSNQDNIRPDVVHLGFEHFEQKFEPSRILCVYETVENCVSLVFFHVEGMAVLFGVGLPFCKVKLNGDSDVEMWELEEQTWRNYWRKEAIGHASPIIFDSTELTDGRVSAARSPQAENLSAEQSAELFGVGVEGIETYPNENLQSQAIWDESAKPPAWLKMLHTIMWEKGDHDTKLESSTHESGLGKVVESGGAVEQDFTDDRSKNIIPESAGRSTLDLSKSKAKDLPQNFGSEGQSSRQKLESKAGDNNETLENQQQLQLSVVVYLNPARYFFFSPVHKKKARFDRLPSKPRTIEVTYPPGSSDVVHMSDHHMVPKVTVRFLYEATVGCNPRKRLRTILKANFHLDGTISNPEDFGWYHDELKLSLRCLDENAVRRNTKDFNEEILSKHRINVAHRGRTTEDGISTARSDHKGIKVNSGDGLLGIAWLNASFKRAHRAETTTKNQATDCNTFEVTCLSGSNFSITKNELNALELAYRASIFPPISYTDMWAQGERESAHASGIMSTVPLKVQGLWTVKKQDDPPPGLALCDYDFVCQRDLIRHRKLTTSEPKTSILCFRPSREADESIEKVQLQQTLRRRFLINHSFSHMAIQNLKRPDAYTWDMTIDETSPSPAIKLLLTSSVM